MGLNFSDPENSTRTLFLFYSRRSDEDGKRLRAAVQRVIPKERIEIFRRLDDLEARLRAPKQDFMISVLLAADRDELKAMTALQDLLKDVHLILAIPDGERHTVELAFHLFPRFLFQKGEDFADVEKVLSKMIQSQPDPKAPDKAARNDKKTLNPQIDVEDRRTR